MKPWIQRPREVRNLFNPAFCGVVLLRGIKAYEEERGPGMPFSLTLLLLPLCLQKESREIVRAGTRSYFLKIVEDNPQIVVGMATRTRSLLPYTLESLGFLMHIGSITVTTDGRIETTPKCIKSTLSGSEETRDCQTAARILGKKFASVGDRVTIYTSFGIRP
jgi:hypothetical protein